MAKRKAADNGPAVAEIVEPEEVALVKIEAGIVSSFLGGMAKFFTGARDLEKAATDKLEAARKLKGKAITSAEQDEKIQRMVKGASADIKGVEDYWEITAKLSQLHKRFVAGRQRPVTMLEEVKQIGNQLHNDWTDSERRRVAAEDERKRIAAEQEAEAERARALARAEADALKLERASATLSEREALYVALVSTGTAGVLAAKRAGYQDPAAADARLQITSKIIKAIDAAKQAAAIRQQAAALKEQPLDVKPIEATKAQITRTAGGHDVTRWSGVLDNEQAIRDAAFDKPDLGIPRDLFVVNPARLNELARALEKRLDLWPGVHAVKKTGVV